MQCPFLSAFSGSLLSSILLVGIDPDPPFCSPGQLLCGPLDPDFHRYPTWFSQSSSAAVFWFGYFQGSGAGTGGQTGPDGWLQVVVVWPCNNIISNLCRWLLRPLQNINLYLYLLIWGKVSCKDTMIGMKQVRTANSLVIRPIALPLSHCRPKAPSRRFEVDIQLFQCICLSSSALNVLVEFRECCFF